MDRLSYERRGDISFIARETISYFVTSERSERGTKYDIVTRAIKLILPSLEYDNLFITKNDIAGQKTISRDKKRYHGTYRFYVNVLSPG